MLSFENLDKFIFPGVGRYGIPQIEPTQEYPSGEFIPVNYHYTLLPVCVFLFEVSIDFFIPFV